VNGEMYVPVASMVPPAAPSSTDHVTLVSNAPATCAVKRNIEFEGAAMLTGVIVTVTVGCGGLVTVTTAPALPGGAGLVVATPWYVPAIAGAVYEPVASTDPPACPSATLQRTPWSAVPATVAVKRSAPPTTTLTDMGAMLTEIRGGGGGATCVKVA